MITYISSIIAGLLISISTFVSPVKQIAPTPSPKISITITPNATSTVTPTIAIVQPQAKKCQFDKEGFIKKAKDYGYTAEEIDTFLTSLPPNYCPNDIANNSINNADQSDQNNSRIIPTVNQGNDIEDTNSYYKYNYPTPNEVPEINIYGNASTYTKIGETTFGSDGSTYTQIGNTVFGNDNSTYQRIGNTIFGNDGSTSTKIGNTTFNNDGTTYTKIGNTTFGSDGSSTIKIGNSTFVNP